MRSAIALLVASTLAPVAAAQTPGIPAASIGRALKAYAESVGACEIGFKNAVEFDVDGDGFKEFVALYYLDALCSGGSGSSADALAVLKYQGDGAKKKLYVVPNMSEPSTQAFGTPATIDRVFVKDGQLWFAGKKHGKDDASNFPTVPLQSSFSLVRAELRVDSDNKHSFYYWKVK
jgi:hypothetical protein